MARNFRTRIKASLVGLGVAAALGTGLGVQASTLDATNPTLNIDNFDVWVQDGSYTRRVNGVNEFGLTGFVLSDFGTGSPITANSTFTDYIVLQLQSFKDASTSIINGTNLNSDYEVSVYIKATGQMTNVATGAFKFTGIETFALNVDATPNGGFSTVAALNGLLDGNQALQSGGGLVGLTSPPDPLPNTGQLEASLGASGEFNIQFLIDQFAGYGSKCFLLDAGTDTCLFDLSDIASLTAAEVTLRGQSVDGVQLSSNATFDNVFNNFQSVFGVSGGDNLYLSFVATTPDTNIASVPEPATVGLVGAALLGLAAVRRRRLKA